METPFPELPSTFFAITPSPTIFRIMLAGGTILEFPLLDDALTEALEARFVDFFEELWAVPGVQEVFEKYEVVVRKGKENP